MSDNHDDLTALGHRVDRQLDAVDARVDATRNQLDILRMDLAGKIDAARQDMAPLVVMWIFGSTGPRL